MLKFNPKDETFTRIKLEVSDCTEKWIWGTAWRNKIIVLPYNEKNIIIIDTDDDSIEYSELEYKGKPSGLNITEATYWIHVLQEENEPFCFVIIPVKKLKIIVKKLIESGEKPRMVGDGNNSKCLIVKKEILLNYELYREENNGKKTKS